MLTEKGALTLPGKEQKRKMIEDMEKECFNLRLWGVVLHGSKDLIYRFLKIKHPLRRVFLICLTIIDFCATIVTTSRAGLTSDFVTGSASGRWRH